MQHLLGIAVAGCLLAAAAEAKALKWQTDEQELRWSPARQTYALNLNNLGVMPTPTAAPVMRSADVLKRGPTDNTCAYVGGRSDIPLYCDTTQSCVLNSAKSVVGCCDDNVVDCPVWTTCIDATDSSLFTTNNGYTQLCTSSEYPWCITHIYADPGLELSGYTIYACGKTKGTDKIFYSPKTDAADDATPLDTSLGEFGGGSGDATATDDGGSQVTVGVKPERTEGINSNDPKPVGAIVGGVVGGVGGLILLALAIFFLIRRHNKKKHAAAQQPAAGFVPPSGPQSPGAPHGGYFSQPQQPMAQQPNFGPSPSPPSQQQQQQQQQGGYHQATAAGFAPLDNRNSVAKPPYLATTTTAVQQPQPPYNPSAVSSPPASPPPPHDGSPSPQYTQYPSGVPSYVQPPQPQPQPQSWYGPPPPQQQQQQQGHQMRAHEMPITRGDGELREMAG